MDAEEAKRLVALHYRLEYPLMWVGETEVLSYEPPVFKVRFEESGRVYEVVVSGPNREDLTTPTLI